MVEDVVGLGVVVWGWCLSGVILLGQSLRWLGNPVGTPYLHMLSGTPTACSADSLLCGLSCGLHPAVLTENTAGFHSERKSIIFSSDSYVQGI